jgi:cell division protein FtsQ
MNRKMKILFSIIVIIGLILFFRSRISNYDRTICSEFRIEFPDSNSVSYISSEQLRNEVRADYQPIEGAVISDIDLGKVKDVIASNPYVCDVHVFKSLDAVITAEVTMRKPLIRVFDKNGNSYMVDQKGEIMPVPEDQLFYLICVSGCVPELTSELYGKRIQQLQLKSIEGSEALNASWMIASVLDKDKEFSELISQIYVESGDSIELIPAIGDFTINFGKPDELEVKLEKLKILYSKIIPFVDMNQYTGVDITIKNQFVFQKNMSYETEREQ